MDFLRKHRKICSAVAALMVAVLVVYSYGSFRSYAAAPDEVSSLPADIDIDVSYDADTVTFTYNSITHSISRKSRYEWINTDGSSSYPYTLESNISGYYVPASYWFSPSENRLYVFSGTTGYGITASTNLENFSYILGYVASSNKATTDIVGCFYTHNNSRDKYEHYMYFVDYNNNYICNSSNICTRNGDSRDRLMCCWASNGSYINGVRVDEYLSEDPFWHYLPSDLVCIFSNYNISGFYEIDTIKVNTPSYYFNYQYIFYKEGYGYIFVDSAKRLKEVGFPHGVTNLRFYFDGEGNNYVYTSSDGITWVLKSTYYNMYNSEFEVSCGYEFTDYTLVYTNDKSFGGDPLVTPDYGSISDVTDNLKDIVNDKPLSGRLVSLFTDMNVSDLLLRGVIADGFDMWIDSSDNSTHIGPRGGAPDDPHVVQSVKSFPSISMYLYNLVNTELNIDTKLSALRIDLHADLKSIFTNITLTNQYLKRLSDNFDNLSFPDYSGKLDNIYNALLFQGSNSSLDSVGKYVQYIYSVSRDIRTRLDTIIDKMPSGSGSVDVDTDSIVTAINDGSDTLHSDLKYIKALLTIDTVNKLFGDDNDSQNIFNFVTKGIASIVSGSIISDALAFSTNTKDGIIYISSYVNKFYDAVPVYSAVVTVGASFFIIDMVLRRKS